jgi:SSS family solute:Na+ symporter
MNIFIFIGALFLLQIVCLIVGKKASANAINNQEDYFLAGRTVRFFPLLMTLIATQIGGGIILGSAEEAYRYGWYVILYPLGTSLGLFVLALGIGKRMMEFPISTVAQLFEVVYKSTKLRKVASVLSMVSLFLILIAQVIASKKFMVSLGVEQNLLFVAFWGIVILYTVTGGLKAVVATDIIQATFFIGVFAMCFGYSLWMAPENTMTAAYSGVSQDFEFDATKLCGWLMIPLLFMVIEQDMGQRCFSAKSGKTVSWASGIAALCTLAICVVPLFYGILGRSMMIAVPEGSSVLMTVIRETTTPTLTAFVGVAVLAAIISTADSLINAISSNFTQDFDFKMFKEGKGVGSTKWITFGIAIASLLCSFAFNNVVDLLVLSYELSVSALFVPIFAALILRKGNKASALYSILLGAISFAILRFVPATFLPKEVTSLVFSALGFGLGELQVWLQRQSATRIEAVNSIER